MADDLIAKSDSDSPVPEIHLRWVADAQLRFSAAIEGLDDDAVRAPSLLPGWSVGHVLTHVARNADSHIRRSEAAVRGEVVEQYPGGYAGRASDIERGARRPPAAIIEDVAATSASLQSVWGTLRGAAWTMQVRDVSGRHHVLRAMPSRRWRELEIHLVDLDIGPSYDDWPEEFVAENLPELRRTLDGRLQDNARPAEPGELSGREELAWLCGRLHRPGLADLLPWG